MLALILLPGMDGTGDLFAPFIQALGPAHQVHVVRYPTDAPWGYAELESFARAALPANQPFVLLGESFSGPIAISLAASAPPQLKALVLCCSFASAPRPSFKVLAPLAGLVPVSSVPMGLLNWFLLGRRFSTVALRSALSRALSEVSPAALRARLRAVLSVDASAKLAACTLPTLYLCASHDRVVPRSAARHVARLKPSTEVIHVEAPHFMLQAVPAQAASAVLRFMREVQGGL